eukprot:4941520-Alexandrium_andersonii.AAC.1
MIYNTRNMRGANCTRDLMPACTHLPGGPGMAALMPALYTTAWHHLCACSNWFRGECTDECPCMRLTSGVNMWTLQLRLTSGAN